MRFWRAGTWRAAISESVCNRCELPDHQKGLIVVSLEPEGPAAKAGVLIGDILLALGGVQVSDTDDLQGALESHGVGTWSGPACCAAGAAGSRDHSGGAAPEGLTCAGLGEVAERLRRSTVQVFTGRGKAARAWCGAPTA